MSADRILSSEPPHGVSVPPPHRRWMLRIGIPAALLLTMAVIVLISLRESLRRAIPVEALPVVELPAIRQTAVDASAGASAAVIVQAAGWIEPDPYPIAVAALATGTVAEVLVREGDAVSAGEVLVRLDAADARLALDRAEAERRAAEARWELNTENTRALAMTASLVAETSAALALSLAERDAVAARAREAERTWRRYERLAGTGSAAEADLNAAEAAWNVAQADLAAAEARVAAARARHDAAQAEASAAVENARHRVEERRALDLARVGEREARLRLERMELRAPISGIVMRRLVAPGARLLVDSDAPEAAHALLLFDRESLQVRVDVPLADAAQVGVGTPAEVTVELLPNRRFRGTVTRVAGEADIQKNTLQVKVRLEESAPGLRPEMLARVRFLREAARPEATASTRAVFVPAAAVRDDHAWVVRDFDGRTGSAARRSLRLTGAERDGWLEVAEGLRPGDLVVTSASAALHERALVLVQPSTEAR